MSLSTIENRVKTILKVDEQAFKVVSELILNQMEALEVKLGTPVPAELDFIVVETSIARYNRLGSEGLKSEGIDVISQTFIEDVFQPYLSDIALFKKANTTVMPSKLRML